MNHRVFEYFPKFHQDASHFLLHLQVPCFLYPSIQCIRTLTNIIPASSNSPSVKILQYALLSFFKCPVVCLPPHDPFVLQCTMFALNDHLSHFLRTFLTRNDTMIPHFVLCSLFLFRKVSPSSGCLPLSFLVPWLLFHRNTHVCLCLQPHLYPG